jgi:competence protein ComEA
MKLNTHTKVVILLTMVIVGGLLYILLVDQFQEEGLVIDMSITGTLDQPKDSLEEELDIEDEVIQLNYVFVCGAVKTPGVYEFEEDTRVFQVLELAGGFSEDAHEHSVNLAGRVLDGQMIYIPTLKEVEEGYTLEQMNQQANNQLVNLNTASLNQLLTLPGIGEAKANNIIKYRNEKGGFQSIEDIMNVEGIKDGVFNKIKNFITV